MNELQRVTTDRAPSAVGPYSQAIVAGNLVFCSGQVALDPASGELQGGDVAAQTEQIIRNLDAVLQASGSSLDRVVKTTVFLVDINDFAALNEAYERGFGGHRPARSTVGVAALPRAARVEIECVAVRR